MRTRFAHGVLALVAIVGLSSESQATERHVPNEYSTIQAAVDACTAGDEIVIADGVYTGAGSTDVSAYEIGIVIRSAKGPASCIIDG